MDVNEMVLSASLEELKHGYVEEEERYVCLCCGFQAEKGVIYPDEGMLYEAARYMKAHIRKEHGSPFDFLLSLDKSATGLSDIQKNLLTLFYQGKSDAEIQRSLSVGSASTIRNHRFALREKERQARVFLAVMELLRDRTPKQQPGGTSAGARARSKTAAAENGEVQVLGKYLLPGEDGSLRSFPAKESHKRVVLNELAGRFESGRDYSEREVNDILESVFDDYVVLRRSLVDYGYLDREADGSRYWLKDRKGGGNKAMSRKEELKQMAKEIKIEGGVFQIRNNRNGKILLESTRNFKTMNGHEFSLRMGSFKNKELQQEWNEYGADAFSFEILEKLKKKETGYFDEKEELRKLKDKWLRELQPYGEKGYNSPKEEGR